MEQTRLPFAALRFGRLGIWSRTPDNKLPAQPDDCLARIDGRRINGAEFLGPLWSPTRQVLIFQGDQGNWFYGNDTQRAENALDHLHFCEPRRGYAFAFSAPPYRLRGSSHRQTELFRQITSALMPPMLPFPDLAVHIYEWNTEWSAYFDAGREWWGSFLWTVWWPGREIVVIAASSTD